MTADPTENQPAETPDEPNDPEPAAETADDRLPDDHPVVKALAKANKEAEQARLKVKEFEDAQKSEQEKLAEALEAAKADSSTSKAEAARLRAAIKHGLSEDDLDLLGNGTPEEIEQRAVRLAERIGSKPSVPARPEGPAGGGAPSNAEETRTPQQLADEVIKRSRGY